jgi:hypothetical protein
MRPETPKRSPGILRCRCERSCAANMFFITLVRANAPISPSPSPTATRPSAFHRTCLSTSEDAAPSAMRMADFPPALHHSLGNHAVKSNGCQAKLTGNAKMRSGLPAVDRPPRRGAELYGLSSPADWNVRVNIAGATSPIRVDPGAEEKIRSGAGARASRLAG